MVYSEDMRYFFSVVEHGSFSETAAIFNISQPTLTRRITRLETELGCKLFYRAKKGEKAQLTHLGMEFYEIAKELSVLINEKRVQFEKAKNRELSILTIGVLENKSMTICNKALKKVAEQYPNVSFVIDEKDERGIYDSLRDDSLDFAFSFDCPNDEELNSRLVGSISLVAIIRKDHPLANNKSLRVSDIKNERLIVGSSFERSTSLYSWMKDNDLLCNVIAKYTQPHNGLNMAESGLGLMLASDGLYSVDFNPILTTVPFENKFKRNLYVIWRKDAVLTEYHKLFLESV